MAVDREEEIPTVVEISNGNTYTSFFDRYLAANVAAVTFYLAASICASTMFLLNLILIKLQGDIESHKNIDTLNVYRDSCLQHWDNVFNERDP